MKKLLTICLLTAMLLATAGCTKPNKEENKSSGQILLTAFEKAVNENPAANSEELANIIIENEIIRFSPMVMPVTEDWLMGFASETIEGFKEAALFGPSISTIPFLGYIFILEDGTDVSSFIENLKTKADLNWNICTSAEEVTVGNVGQVVFFLMCNKDINAE